MLGGVTRWGRRRSAIRYQHGIIPGIPCNEITSPDTDVVRDQPSYIRSEARNNVLVDYISTLHAKQQFGKRRSCVSCKRMHHGPIIEAQSSHRAP